jgi:hypothetical protein
MEGLRVDFQQGKGFSFPECPDRLWTTTRLPFNGYRVVLWKEISWGVKLTVISV